MIPISFQDKNTAKIVIQVTCAFMGLVTLVPLPGLIGLHTIIPSFLESSSKVVAARKRCLNLFVLQVTECLGCNSPDSSPAYTDYPFHCQ